MITTTRFANPCLPSRNYHFFSAERTFKIHLLINMKVYDTASLALITTPPVRFPGTC